MAATAALASGVFVGPSVGAGAGHATTAPSQELPPLRALTPIASRSEQGYITGYPTFRWQFPSQDGSAQYWVTMDDTPLEPGVHLTGSGTSTFAYVTDWIYEEGIPLADGTSSGSGWWAYFYSNECNGQNDWAIFGASEYTTECPQGAWDEIIADLDALPGSWIHVSPSFEACAQGVQLWGGSCYARFISSSEMSTLVTPVTDVEVYDGQPWDVQCPTSYNSPPCWTAEPPSAGYGVTVQALPVDTPVDPGTRSDSFSIRISNPNVNAVTVSAVSAELPTGFAYAAGTTTGIVTSDPAVDGQQRTWTGPFTIGANNSFTITFGVSMDPQLLAGSYTMSASATTDKTYSGTATVVLRSLTPVIFVPGIMGSKLYCEGDEYWPKFVLERLGLPFGALALTNHGTAESTCSQSLTANGIVGSVYSLKDEYDSTIDNLEANGYALNETLFEYSYDWRKSVESAADGLLALIDTVRAQTGAPKVDILAHSQGGLVTRVALSEGASIGKVGRVLSMATPFYGAEKLLSVELTGTPCTPSNITMPLVFAHLDVCPTTSASAEAVARTLPGAYELLPSPDYFSAVMPPLFAGGRADTFSEYQALLDRNLDPVLVDDAFQYHSAYDAVRPIDPNVQWTQIVGYGKQTISTMMTTDNGLSWTDFGYPDGDGTVPAGSALSGGLFTTMYTVGLDHMAIATSTCTVDFAAQYFQDPTPPPSDCVYPGPRPVVASRLSQDAAPAALELSVDGALTGVVVDGAGHSTDGATDDTAIPDSDYNAYGASQSFLFRAPGSYHAVLTATAPGIVRLRVRQLGLDGATAEALFLIPALPQGAVLSFDSDAQDVGATRVSVDLNGDGSIDETLSPDAVTSGSAVADTTPPTPYGDATLAGLLRSKVTLDAEDSGSGVAHLYYRVGSGREQTYTGPFTVPMFSTVSFRAMDNAGNMSAESSFVADDAPNTQRFADPLTPFRPVIRFIDPQGDVDWFTFQADGRSRYRVQLDELPADYDVQLFDANGNLVAAPRARGRSPETIFQSLPAGTYFVEVSAATDTHGSSRPWDSFLPYRLQLLQVPGR